MKKNNWATIKKILNNQSENELIILISKLYALSTQNKAFLETQFLPNNNTLEYYKSQIKKNIDFDKPGRRINLKAAKKALSDYKKANNNNINLIDLMLYYVECGTEFTYQFGDMYEQYYYSLEIVAEDALKIMKHQNADDMQPFIDRFKVVIYKASHMGWGYEDTIVDLIKEAYPFYNEQN